MNISYNWLKNYLESDITAEEASVILTDIGLEIEDFEKIEAVKGGLSGVVVGEVLTCSSVCITDYTTYCICTITEVAAYAYSATVGEVLCLASSVVGVNITNYTTDIINSLTREG